MINVLDVCSIYSNWDGSFRYKKKSKILWRERFECLQIPMN